MRHIIFSSILFLFFFFNDTATTEIYTLSLHDALPIYVLTRRTRARLLARDDSAAAADDAAALVGRELGWDDAERARQVKEYRAAVAAERDAADQPETALR